MSQLDAAIFDIDGTLVDSNNCHAEAWRLTFAQFGKEIPFSAIRAQIGKGGDQLLPVFFSEEELDRDRKDLEAARGKIFKGQFMDRIQPFPKVRNLFARLHHDGYKITLASSAKKDELERYVQLLGVEDLLEASVSTDDADKSKPHPDIFQAALKNLGGMAPSAVLVVGDTPYDAEAAGKAGLATVGFLCGGFPEADLRAAGAGTIFADPADLFARYEQSPFAGRER